MVTIGSWPGYMADPATGALPPAHYADFAKYCADFVRIINKLNSKGHHLDLFELLNEREGSYSDTGDGLLLGQIVAQAARAMKAVDPSIKVRGHAYSWAASAHLTLTLPPAPSWRSTLRRNIVTLTFEKENVEDSD